MLSFRRGFKQIRRLQPIAQISILCRGKAIGPEELFAYTNGHFLVDEQRQLNRRYVKFDVDALCDVAGAAGNSSRVTSIEKFEGGFSKALLMKKEDGQEVIAKIPCRIAGPACLTTACEVGVLEYVRQNTTIPVPRVFSWSSNASNPVGAEYIIMEKASGVQLFEQWDEMKEYYKLQLIKHLTQLEAQLSAIAFPAYGGLYRRADVSHLDYRELDPSIDPSRLFCIGPSCDRSFGTALDAHCSPKTGQIDQGPWNTISSFGISIAKRELSRISRNQSNKRPIIQGNTRDQVKLLEYTTKLMTRLDSHPALTKVSQPTLWHTDLHMGNIFVAPDDTSRILSLIDFQSLLILPLFLQAQWPVFLKPPSDYPEGIVQPKLPDDFNELDEDSKALALQEWSQSKSAKAYEVSTIIEHEVAHTHTAMKFPRVVRELFIRCGEISEVGPVPLRECLIEMSRNWSTLGFAGECPYSFSDEEIETHEHQFAEYEAWNEAQQLAQECLRTDAEGWVAPQLDIEERRRQNRELLSMYIERMSGEKTPDEVRAMWPFPGS